MKESKQKKKKNSKRSDRNNNLLIIEKKVTNIYIYNETNYWPNLEIQDFED